MKLFEFPEFGKDPVSGCKKQRYVRVKFRNKDILTVTQLIVMFVWKECSFHLNISVVITGITERSNILHRESDGRLTS